MSQLAYGTLEAVRSIGSDWGWCAASNIDLPDIGTVPRKDIDWKGCDPVTDENTAWEVFEVIAQHYQETARLFGTEFKGYVQDIDSRPDTAQAWEAFEAGVSDGLYQNFEERVNRSGFYQGGTDNA
ncbi:hypothetical protein [Pacificispira sp.]|uniref:hypothetical protein n=1 Tax=Pacificispira sp. TaxID=2888761 RepID=UPI003BAC9017